jgi:bifunctional enzyme CysN/CysC
VGGLEVESAAPPLSVTVCLEDDLDVSRGDLLADPARPPVVARHVAARVGWMSERPLVPRARVLVKHTTRTVPALVDELVSKVDMHTLDDVPAPERLELNDLGRVRFHLAQPLVVDPYAHNRTTGAFIVIDETTNDTVAAGMVEDAT